MRLVEPKVVTMNPDQDHNVRVLALARALHGTMDESKWIELGYLTDSLETITEHPGLLRSLKFGDEDYLGCIYQVLPTILGGNDENFNRIAVYVNMEEYLRENQIGLYNLIYDAPKSGARTTDVGSSTTMASNENMSEGEHVCFVIMPFREPINSYYKSIIVPAIIEAGLKPLRADEITEPGAIVQQIWTGIRAAKVCVADLTGQNSNVMYELGLAHALHKPVVSLVQSMDDVPFDLKHLRQVVYGTQSVGWDEQLRMQLVAMLLGTLANPISGTVFN